MKRLIAALLAFVMVVSLLSLPNFVGISAWAADTEQDLQADADAMHFVVRHWHTDEEDGEQGGGSGEPAMSVGAYSIVVEGYIAPKDDFSGFDIYRKIYRENQETDSVITAFQKIDAADGTYIAGINTAAGSVTLKVNPYEMESFSGFSVAAGHDAVTTNEAAQTITVSYRKSVHLVKTHVFYINSGITLLGTTDVAVLGDPAANSEDAQQDTALIYADENGDPITYQVSAQSGQTPEGEPVYTTVTHYVKVGGGEQAYEAAGGDPAALDKSRTVKVYSTLAGLHTDKTATATGDGRTFDLDLEAWFSGQNIANVGLILDASGSMGFTSEALDPINVKAMLDSLSGDAALVDSIRAKMQLTPDGTNWESVLLTEEEVSLLLNSNLTDNSRLSSSGYSYFVYNTRDAVMEYAPLGYWDGNTLGDVLCEDQLIGYYAFNGDKDKFPEEPTRRNWLLNGVTGKYAQAITQVAKGGVFEKTNSAGVFDDTFASDPLTWAYNPLQLSDSTGLTLANPNTTAKQSTEGILLDAKPTGGSFTISFNLLLDGSETDKGSGSVTQQRSEILYIGPMDMTQEGFFRLIREGSNLDLGENGETHIGNSKGRLKGLQDGVETSYVASVNNAFKAGTTVTVTLVYENGKLTSYLNGTLTEGASADTNNNEKKELNLSDFNIIVNGVIGNYDGARIYLDEIYVYDAAMTGAEVSTWYRTHNEDTADDPKYSTNEPAITKSGAVIGAVRGDLFHGKAGWYYVNPTSAWSENYANPSIQSGKTLWGIHYVDNTGKSMQFTDTIVTPDGKTPGANTGATYSPAAGNDTATLFYVDADGYLRCFFASGTNENSGGTSYVYKKDDLARIKAEALQRALGAFVTELAEASPSSKLSAVRFSTNRFWSNYKDIDTWQEAAAADGTVLKNLVMLDWTADTAEAQKMLNLTRGNGGTLNGTWSGGAAGVGLEQFNYGLTGGTYTWTGLRAFYENLATDNNAQLADAAKYLILFTDGLDDDYRENEASLEMAKYYADKLKDMGYTIFTVMLTGGTVQYVANGDGTSNYEKAERFLLALAGTGDENEDPSKYFYVTDIAGLAASGHETEFTSSNTVDLLVQIFSDDIIEQISDYLPGYTVQDYVDPRFDLVAADGAVWHLNAEGKVEIVSADGALLAAYDLKTGAAENDGTDGYPVFDKEGLRLQIVLTEDTRVSAGARKAWLSYENDLYCLTWEDQIIPGCAPAAARLSVWNGKVTVRAKEDFLGGNSVLTNGNDADQNMVFYPQDTDRSSGITDTARGENYLTDPKDYPSKGFPRVTVNVKPYYDDDATEDLVYMGEAIPATYFENLREKLSDEAVLYLDYLDRYVAAGAGEYQTLDALLDAILAAGEEGLSLEYFYLPAVDGANQTGKDAHRADPLGTLTYKWIPGAGENDGSYTDKKPTTDTKTRELKLTVTYTVYQDERETLTNKLVQETVYKWDPAYKPAAGEVVDKYDEDKDYGVEGTQTTTIVSGEILMQMVLSKDVLDLIKTGQTLTYTADLVRSYGSIENEVVGTFTLTYTKTEDATGPVTVTGFVTPSSDYAYADAYHLPIGTYTFVDGGAVTSGGITFPTESLKILNLTEKDGALFEAHGNDVADFGSHIAYADNTAVYLGYNGDAAAYTDHRFGGAVVILSSKIEVKPPQTSDESHPELWLALAVFSLIGTGVSLLGLREKKFGKYLK